MPDPGPGRVSLAVKLTAIFAAGMLLGLGLCGIQASLTDREVYGVYQYVGLAMVGLYTFLASFVGFVISLLMLLFNAIARMFRK